MDAVYIGINDISLTEGILYFSEHNTNITGPLEKVFYFKELTYNSFIYNTFFPWLLVVLFVNKNKWNKPIIYILILFYLCHSMNKLLSYLAMIIHPPPDSIMFFPFNLPSWYLGSVISPLFCFAGEIIGDWYLLIRTKTILGTNKLPKLYITIMLYNISKVVLMIGPFFLSPKSMKDLPPDFNNSYFIFCIVASIIVQITSIIYELTIVHYLRKNLFRKCKNNPLFKKNSFFEKLKQTSEYRIFISVAFSLLIFPVTIFLYLRSIPSNLNTANNNNMADVNNKNDPKIEAMYYSIVNYRYVFVYINYYLMYIDQILLRTYAERDVNNPQFMISYDSSAFEDTDHYSSNNYSSNHYMLNYTPNQYSSNPSLNRSSNRSPSPQHHHHHHHHHHHRRHHSSPHHHSDYNSSNRSSYPFLPNNPSSNLYSSPQFSSNRSSNHSSNFSAYKYPLDQQITNMYAESNNVPLPNNYSNNSNGKSNQMMDITDFLNEPLPVKNKKHKRSLSYYD